MSDVRGSGASRLWVLAALIATVAVTIVFAALSSMLQWPPNPLSGALCGIILFPAAVVAGRSRPTVRGEQVLVATTVAAGLVVMVALVYLLIVIGLGHVPVGDERQVLVLSIGAATVAAILAFPMRRWLSGHANQWVYGERHAPDEALRAFGGRMSRSVPMDELLLQLVESLKKTMRLTSAEIWTGTNGRFRRTVSMPERGPGRLTLRPEEVAVVARAHAQGRAWMQIWTPSLLAGRDDALVLSVSVAHLGKLLGLIVLERPGDGAEFTDEEDRVLVDLARQVGLALHNMRLDSALQASLEEVRIRNAELIASRARIVAAADESRRRIERDLHDGAQQHLVALAVQVGLIRTVMPQDRETGLKMLDELRREVQATLAELRELAHGIYPPLLRDRGLAEALRNAANRAPLPTRLSVADNHRYPADIEAAVYFCCLEAIQNAGKYAGDRAEVTVFVGQDEGLLTFEVIDTGIGFDVAATGEGHGFVNMRDRMGAFGGDLSVESSPGKGTRVRGRLPVGSGARREGPLMAHLTLPQSGETVVTLGGGPLEGR